MLTSVFYYNLYRPYIVGNANNRDNNVQRRQRIATGTDNIAAGRQFVLNKSIRNDIINYANAVTYSVTDLRESTGRTAQEMANFNRTVHQEGWNEAVSNLTYNLSGFAEDYNQATRFMLNQEHSGELLSFSNNVMENVYYNRQRLEMLGLTLSSEGRMAFSRSQVESMNFEEINVAIGENLEIFEGLRSYTQQLMSEPLVDHMRFRGLSYHYNYQMGRLETDGFNLIETGMIFDRLV